jgi:hypothetical protein
VIGQLVVLQDKHAGRPGRAASPEAFALFVEGSSQGRASRVLFFVNITHITHIETFETARGALAVALLEAITQFLTSLRTADGFRERLLDFGEFARPTAFAAFLILAAAVCSVEREESENPDSFIGLDTHSSDFVPRFLQKAKSSIKFGSSQHRAQDIAGNAEFI